MSDDIRPKEKTFEFPMMPIFGVDLGERLGEFAAGQKQMRGDVQELKAEIHELKAEIKAVDGRVDKCLVAINRLDERMNALADGRKSDRNLLFGILAAVIAGFISQYFK